MEIDPEREAFMLAAAEKAFLGLRTLFDGDCCHPPLVVAARAGLTVAEFLALVARHPDRFGCGLKRSVYLKPSPERSPIDAANAPAE